MSVTNPQVGDAKSAWEHWILSHDEDNIAWLAIDCLNQSTNTLSSAVLEKLGEVIDAIERSQPRGFVFHSTKACGFVVGADIAVFEQLQDPGETEQKINIVHELFKRIERLHFPTLASVRGFCLDGGLELALACRYCIVDDDALTRLGVPEVLLGTHPGFGGTVRLIERLGVLAAMDLMLTGRNVDATRAAKTGLVDRAVPTRQMDNAIRSLLRRQPKRKPLGLLARTLNTTGIRRLVGAVLRRQVARRAPEQHYRAPYAFIRLWQEHGGDRYAMFRAEAHSIARLFVSATSRYLQRLFFLQERLKSLGRETDFSIRHVHVIGAGTMGGDIASWCAMRGLRVTVQDREIRFIAAAIKRAKATFKARIKDRYRRAVVEDDLVIDLDGDGIVQADVIIEAIVENLEAKQVLFQQIEKKAKTKALIASNTSSIPLEDIAAGMQDESRLVGIHFFKPVAKMQLIEIIGGSKTDRRQLNRAAAFATLIDRQPLPAISSPGFLINRILSPYLQEAMTMLDEGLSPTLVDQVAIEFGMPMGPIELADAVGLDICLSVGEVLASKLRGSVPQSLRRKVERGHLGRKNNEGFYRYEGKRVIRPKIHGSGTAEFRYS
jgi:3-hydroxyacyl-CoA dehydrogenase/enoyl-CoA hydratase/3-hydroxybutyryl-CoA epimerase